MLAIFVLPAFIISLLQIGFIQTFAAQRLAVVLSDELHTDITIGSVNVSFLLDFILKDVKINDLHHNTMLESKAMIINMNDLFIDRNVISVHSLVLDNPVINLIKYKGEKSLNYQFIADYFSSGDTTSAKGGKNWKIWIATFKLINASFKYQDQDETKQDKGIDFNNLDLTGINTRINNIVIIGDSIFADIRSLSLKDRSGFDLKKFSALAKVSTLGLNLKNLHLETATTRLSMDLEFKYKSYEDFNSFIDKVKISALFKPSKIDLNDIGFFAPDLLGMNDKINIAGEVRGKISNLKGKKFQLLYGRSTYFIGNFNISGLPDIETTYIHFNISNFFTCQYDLQTFILPSTSGLTHLELPDEVAKLGNVRFKGNFTGFYNDFVAYGNFFTDMGNISTDLTLRKNHSTNKIEYNGKVATANLNIGDLLGMQNELGYISMDANVTGSGLDAENVAVNIKGNIAAIDFNKYNYKNINIEGDLAKKKFNGFLRVDDENVKLDLTGMIDYSKDLPVYNVKSKIENLRLSKLHFLELTGDSVSSLSSNLELNFEGNAIDNIQGTIHAKNTSYTYKGDKYFLNDFKFINTAEKNGNKTIDLKSDYVDANFSGNFMFNDLYLSSLKFIKDYLPSYSSWIKEKLDSIPEQNFVYFIRLKNTTPLSKLFMPEIYASPNTVLKGSYNSKQSILELNFSSAISKYQDTKFKDFFLSCKTKDSKIYVNVGAQQIELSDSIGLDNVTLKSVTKNDTINYKLAWENNNDKIKNSGNINGFLSFLSKPRMEMKFTDASLVINDSTWTIEHGNDIVFDSTAVNIENLVFFTNNQKLKISGTISHNPSDLMNVSFTKFNISDFDMLTTSSNVDIDGYLTGEVQIYDIYRSVNIVSNLSVDEFYVNKDKLGKALLSTSWNDKGKVASINADIFYEGSSGSNKPISIAGYYYPERKKENFDIDISLANFKLKLLEKYISGFSSNFKGFASGKLKLSGTPEEPNLYGHLFMIVKGFKIDYLNENYSFTDSVLVTKNSFSFDHIIINDSHGDTAVLDGKITHKNFNDLNFDLAIKAYNFECLNTNASKNSQFYGKANITGLVKITGDVNNINIDVSAKTEKNTKVFIPITSESEISENDYIHFVSKKNRTIKNDDYNVDLSGITLNFDLDVTPDADLQIIFDSKIGDIIKAKGNGNLKMEITALGDFNMYGDYVIDEGDYLFTLKNVINKKFIIQKGSSLKWNGSPYDAYVDITAVYPVKTALYDLGLPIGSNIDSAVYKKRTDVNCLLHMKDKILNPTITFDIELPNSNDEAKTFLKSKTNNEEGMNHQVFSLLILNRFTVGDPLQNASSGLGNTSTELLSNQLSNWLSQISRKVDIGVNYRPGNDISSEELEVALSTQLFNDKLIIDGNVGVSGNQPNQNNSGKTSNIVGDVNMEYKLTDDGRFRLKGYNKSNTVDLLNTNSPYTQGIGLLYRREFDSLSELFRKKKTNEKKLKLKN